MTLNCYKTTAFISSWGHSVSCHLHYKTETGLRPRLGHAPLDDPCWMDMNGAVAVPSETQRAKEQKNSKSNHGMTNWHSGHNHPSMRKIFIAFPSRWHHWRAVTMATRWWEPHMPDNSGKLLNKLHSSWCVTRLCALDPRLEPNRFWKKRVFFFPRFSVEKCFTLIITSLLRSVFMVQQILKPIFVLFDKRLSSIHLIGKKKNGQKSKTCSQFLGFCLSSRQSFCEKLCSALSDQSKIL